MVHVRVLVLVENHDAVLLAATVAVLAAVVLGLTAPLQQQAPQLAQPQWVQRPPVQPPAPPLSLAHLQSWQTFHASGV